MSPHLRWVREFECVLLTILNVEGITAEDLIF